MTVLSGSSIRARKILDPCRETYKVEGMSAGLSHAGYDVTLELPEGKQIIVLPGDFRLLAAAERFTVPNDVMGFVKGKSTWARAGLLVFNTVIEPSWCGYLTLEVANLGENPILLEDGYPIAQIIFHYISGEVEGYDGKYQDQGRGPQGPRYE